MDLLAVLLVFMTAQRLFRRDWLSLLAAAFYACAVLPIQLSHYMAVDTFTNTFALLAFLLCRGNFGQPGIPVGRARCAYLAGPFQK